MDILYQLPFPDELCSKIFCYACKTPHTGLAVEVLKNRLNVKHLDIPEKDEDVTCINIEQKINYPLHPVKHIYFYTYFKNLIVFRLDRTPIIGDIVELNSLPNLIVIALSGTGVIGDIIHLKSLHNLTAICLQLTCVTGDIIHLNSLLNLTEIDLEQTGVTGDILHLKSLSDLICIYLQQTDVMGDFTHIKSLPKLTEMDFRETGVSGDEDAFHKYRGNAGFSPDYELYL